MLELGIDITERKRAEEALRRQEEFLTNALEALTHPFYVLDANDYTIKLANSAANADRLSESATCYARIHRQDGPCTGPDHVCPLERVKKTKRPVTVEHIHWDKDGRQRAIKVHGFPVLDRKGEVVEMIEYCLDITERRRAEQALRESELELSTIYDNAPVVMLLVDRERRVRKMNVPAVAMARRPGQDAIGLRGGEALRCIHAHDDPKGCGFGRACEACGVRNGVLETFRTGKSLHTVEACIPCELVDGPADVWVLLSTALLKLPQEDMVLACMEDITERKRAQEALRRSQQEWENTFNAISDWVSVIDREFRVLRSNPAGEKFTGVPLPQMLGQTCCKLVHGADQPLPGCPVEKMLRTRQRETLEIALPNPERWIAVTADPVMDEQGNLVGAVHVVRDMTERQRAEERIRQHQEKLAHVSRVSTMGEMASGIAHELNQPLFSIMNYAEACKLMVQSSKAGSDEIIANLDKVVAAADNAGNIVRRLRNFVRKREPRRSTVDINQLVREVTHAVRAEAQRSDVEVRLELSPKIPPALADSILIQQVTLNLARNAIEAMSENEAGQRELIIRTSVAGIDEVEVTVCDSGPGTSDEAMDRLFEPFFTTKPEGLGLGLSISQSIVEANGGRLVASPNPDRGMTFRFTLPMTSGDQNHGV